MLPSHGPVCLREQRKTQNLDSKSCRNKGRPLPKGGQQHKGGEDYKKSRKKQQAGNQLQGVSFDEFS